MLSLKWSLALAAAIAASPAMAAYKCKDQYGRTIYQEVPCESKGSTGAKIDTTPSAQGVTSDTGYGKISIGMTAEEVRRAWGAPTKINTSIGTYGRNEQWIYRNANGAQYVYIENGVVRSMQDN